MVSSIEILLKGQTEKVCPFVNASGMQCFETEKSSAWKFSDKMRDVSLCPYV